MLPAFPAPVLLAETLAPFDKVTELPAEILMLPPVPCVALLLTVLALLLKLTPLMLIEPPPPAPVLLAEMLAPLLNATD